MNELQKTLRELLDMFFNDFKDHGSIDEYGYIRLGDWKCGRIK